MDVICSVVSKVGARLRMPSHCTRRRVLEKLALGSSLLLALMGATVVGEQMWENDLSILCLLESRKGMWEHNPPRA